VGDVQNQRVFLGVVLLVALSAVVAGFVIFSDSAQTASRPSETPRLAVVGDTLVMGPTRGAAHEVTVREDFGCAPCRAFDEASRDYLRIEAAHDRVRVTYEPEAATGSGEYAGQAFAAWQDATGSDAPRKVLALHGELYDEAPTSGAPSPDLPVVTVDGTRLDGTDGTALADRLQGVLVEGQR
jgi:hypothetical protein